MQTQGFWPTICTVEDYSESLTSECAEEGKAITTQNMFFLGTVFSKSTHVGLLMCWTEVREDPPTIGEILRLECSDYRLMDLDFGF